MLPEPQRSGLGVAWPFPAALPGSRGCRCPLGPALLPPVPRGRSGRGRACPCRQGGSRTRRAAAPQPRGAAPHVSGRPCLTGLVPSGSSRLGGGGRGRGPARPVRAAAGHVGGGSGAASGGAAQRQHGGGAGRPGPPARPSQAGSRGRRDLLPWPARPPGARARRRRRRSPLGREELRFRGEGRGGAAGPVPG